MSGLAAAHGHGSVSGGGGAEDQSPAAVAMRKLSSGLDPPPPRAAALPTHALAHPPLRTTRDADARADAAPQRTP